MIGTFYGGPVDGIKIDFRIAPTTFFFRFPTGWQANYCQMAPGKYELIGYDRDKRYDAANRELYKRAITLKRN